MSRPTDEAQTEREWQDIVVDAARLHGWLVMHARPARTSKGWRTPIQGDPGFPDLVLLHEDAGWIVFAELKAERGHLTADQRRWVEGLASAAEGTGKGVGVYVWRPSDWPEVVRVLREGPS